MDELYFTAGPPLKIGDTVNNSDPVFLSIVLLASIIQITYICYILRVSCRQR